MKNFLLGAALLGALASTTAYADVLSDGTIIDPLHFSCANCGIDNGTFTPSNDGIPTGITVTSSPANSGDLTLKILIPNNEIVGALSSDTVTGTVNTNTSYTAPANLFSTTAWSSGSLEMNYLGFTNLSDGSPPNDISAFLPSTQAVDPGATGFYLLTLDLGQVNLNTPGGSSPISLNVATEFAGGWIMGDLLTSDGCKNGVTSCDEPTAQSAALFVEPFDSVPGPTAGAGIPGLLAGLGLFGFVEHRRRRNRLA